MGRGRILCAAGLLALVACAPPLLRLADPGEIHTGKLAFLVEGTTTREDVLLHLGTPNAHFEGERILTYAFRQAPSGEWIRDARSAGGRGEAPEYRSLHGRIHSLVMVFGPDGRLLRHSLVMSR